MTSSCKVEGCGLSTFRLKPLKIEKIMRSTLATLTKQTMGRVRRRTSTKQRSMTLVVRSFLHKAQGKLKKERRVSPSPVASPSSGRHPSNESYYKATERGFRLRPTVGMIDGLRLTLHVLIVPLPNLLQNVAHLMHPATLMEDARVDPLQGRCQSRATTHSARTQGSSVERGTSLSS